MSDETPPQPGGSGRKKQIHRDFGKRLTQAADNHPHTPLPNYGRLGWVKEQLDLLGQPTTIESVRRWFAGESRPRDTTLKKLAEIFQVDDAWLTIGYAPELTPKEKVVRSREASGAVNVLAGVIQMEGGHPAFPDDGDADVDLHAIIRGAKYEFKVVLSRKDAPFKFVVPSDTAGCIVIGIVPRENHGFDFYEIEPEVLATGKNRGGYIELSTEPEKLRKIETFGERI